MALQGIRVIDLTLRHRGAMAATILGYSWNNIAKHKAEQVI